MSCCEKLKIERLKDITHASVLACQEANIRNVPMAVVKLKHKDYGDYFQGVPLKDTKAADRLRVFNPGDTMKPKVKQVTEKVNTKKPVAKKKAAAKKK